MAGSNTDFDVFATSFEAAAESFATDEKEQAPNSRESDIMLDCNPNLITTDTSYGAVVATYVELGKALNQFPNNTHCDISRQRRMIAKYRELFRLAKIDVPEENDSIAPEAQYKDLRERLQKWYQSPKGPKNSN